MSISRELSELWAQKPDDTTPTIDSVVGRITDALDDPLGPISYTVDTNGSQKNGTNIPGMSDCDLTVSLESEFTNPHERFEQWSDFRDLVRHALEERFNAEAIDLSLKCINIDTSLELPPIDILPCLARTALINGIPVDVIEFWTNEHRPRQIMSSPSTHLRNGNEKDAGTDGAAKQLVRVVKHGRALLVASDRIGPTTAPSYMIESSVMNMSEHEFTGDPLEDIRAYVSFMRRALHPSSPISLMAGNGLHPLIGRNRLRQWDIRDAALFTRELAEITD